MGVKKPKISIITINYNHAVGLKKTIESVVSQNLDNAEYLIIDGASTDGSAEIIKSHEQHLAYWVSEKDRGIYHAMNKGIEAAKGEYLLFLNSGDYLHDPDVLSNVLRMNPTADLAYGHLRLFDKEREWTWLQPSTLSFEVLYQSTIPHPSTFIKRALFEEVGLYDEQMKIVSDWKFFLLALAKHNCSYQRLDAMITSYNFDGLSSKPENLAAIEAERKQVLDAHFPFFVADYDLLKLQRQELKKISYFLKTRKLIKKILRQK